MATWTVNFYPFNLLALATVDVTGDPDTGFPESRLYDRAISLYWRDTATEAKSFHIDQGAAGNLAVDFLAVAKHNFDGTALAWQYSSDDFSVDINDAVPAWTQSGNAQIIKLPVAAITSRYWRLTLASMANPRCSEIYLSNGFAFNCLREQNPSGEDAANVQWNTTVGGVERSTKYGPTRRVRRYTFYLSETEFADFKAVADYLDDYSLPFYFKDHKGAYFLARFAEVPQFDFNHATHTMVSVQLIEML
jgi:hypothetical protein